jgi:hypothetical protein
VTRQSRDYYPPDSVFGAPPQDRYEHEHPKRSYLEWVIVLLIAAIIICILFGREARASEDGTLWLSDGSKTTTETTLYNKPGEAHSMMVLDLPPAPPYYLQVESLAGVSTFGIAMVGGDVGATVDIGDFDIPVFGYFPLIPYGPYILDVNALVQSLPPQQRTVGFRLVGFGEIWSLDTECGLVPQIVPEPSALGTLGAFLGMLAGTVRRRR